MSPPSQMLKIRVVTLVVVIVLLLIIIFQNSAPTRLSLLFINAELPLMLWLGLFLITGILIGVALMWSYRRHP